MNFIEAAIFILFFAVISVPFANRFRLPLEVFLVIGSCLISLAPWIPSVEVDPTIVFYLILPPILFHAAYFISWRDFKLNIRVISLLAFGLVIFTMCIVALVAKYILPQLSLAECFILGAIISPTDAASATAIIKKLRAPQRLVTILEGESLVNDSTALILFRFSLITFLSGSFSIPIAITQFFTGTLSGIAIGLIIGIVAVRLLQKINSVSADTTFTFIVPLITYLAAENMHASGVIATVVCGIYFGVKFPEVISSKTRIYAKVSWNTLIFIINCFAFTLIGLELPLILKDLTSSELNELILYGIIISLVVIFARIIWVFILAYLSRALFPSIARKDPMPPWQAMLTLGWCGMRGIVSLAAALSLPLFIAPNTAFAHRSLIVFLTYCVIVVSITIPSFTLPVLLRLFKFIDFDNKVQQEALARVRSLEGITRELQDLAKKEKIPDTLFHEFRNQIDRRIKVIKTQLSETPYSTLNNEYQYVKKLALAAIESERSTLLKLRKTGEIHEEVFNMLLDELDIEELRAKTLRL